MSKLADFVGGGGGGNQKPFQDLGTVTGTVNLDVATYGSFRVVQGDGDITLNVIGDSATDAFSINQLYFYPNDEWSVTFTGANVENYFSSTINIKDAYVSSRDNEIPTQSASAFNIDSMVFSKDGLKLFQASRGEIFQYTLTEPFDIKTATYDSVVFDTLESTTECILFNDDGTRFYALGNNDLLDQYDLSTPYDLSTLTDPSVSYDMSAQNLQPVAVRFNPTGDRLLMMGLTNNVFYNYTLSTPFDISTLTVQNSEAYTAVTENAIDFVFNSSGSQIYLLSDTTTSDSAIHVINVEDFTIYEKVLLVDSFELIEVGTSTECLLFGGDGNLIHIGRAGGTYSTVVASFDYGLNYVYSIVQNKSNITIDSKTSEINLKGSV